MTKEAKVFIGLGLAAVAAYLLLKPKVSSEIKALMDDDKTENGLYALSVCKENEVPCPSNPKKCYNPKLDYFADPCKA